jgi:hypothetical protein
MGKNTEEIIGNLELDIDGPGLKAEITITKSSEGAGWTADKIVSLLSEKGVKEGIKRRDISDALGVFGKKKDRTLSFTAAEGLPPEQPVAEKAEFEKLDVPEAMKEEAEQILSSAPPPDIRKEIIDKVKKEKVVTKKPKLPFMAAKKEKVTVTEKVSRFEKVYIDPTVEWTGYAEEGQKIAELSPYQPGIPGRSIFSESVPAVTLPDPYFYAGQGVGRKRNELFAEYTGFIRKGSNWVDMLAFRSHDWQLELSKDKATCLLTFNPGDPQASRPDITEIHLRAEELEFPSDRLLPDARIQEIIDSAVSENKALESVPISGDQDASIEIAVSDDKLKGTLSIRKGTGRGKTLVLKEIGSAIKQSGFKNMDLEKVKKDIMEFYESPRLEMKDYVLVEGKAPTKGPPRQAEFSVRFIPGKEVERIKEYITEHPESMEGITSASAYPLNEVEEMGLVQEEQRVIAISPVVKGENGVDVYGNTAEGIPGEEPQLQIFENLDKKENVVISKINGILDRTAKDEAVYLRVRPHRDAEISVTLSEDRMCAFLSITPAEGSGKKPTMRALEEELKRRKVERGLNDDVVKEALEKARAGGEINNLLIAEGQSPKNTQDAQMKLLVHIASGSDVVIRSDGSADYKSHDKITTVPANTKIAQIIPPQDTPEDGWDVCGKTIDSKVIKAFDIEIGKNIKQEEQEDGVTVLLSEISGQLIYDNKHIHIEPAHFVKGDINLDSGNIKFPGSVSVSGSVGSGFYVLSGGEIRIGEGVEAALLSAEEGIYIKQGVKGGGKAVLRAKKDVAAQFIEQATVLAVEDVRIKNSCVRSNVKTNGKLLLTGDRGTILGGKIRARHGVEATNLGSERGAETFISFGQNYLIADQIELEQNNIDKIKKRTAQLDMEMRKTEKIKGLDQLEKLRKEKVKLLKVMEKRGLRLFTLKERFEEHFSSEIKIKGTVYPGVKIESHGRIHEFKSEKKAISVSFNPSTGHIEETPLEK